MADVRSKILSSLVSQFGGRLKEGMMQCGLAKMREYGSIMPYLTTTCNRSF